ncbi:hypothetical protein D3C72_2059180 [compost metagenome]
MRLQCCLEFLDVRTLRRIGQPGHVYPVGLEKGVKIEVTRVIHQHGIAGLQQEAADEVYRLGTRFGEHDLLRWRFNIVGQHAPRKQLAQRQLALGGGIFCELQGVCPSQRAQGPPHSALVKPVGWQPAATRSQHGTASFQCLA